MEHQGGREQGNFIRYEANLCRNLRPKNPNILKFYQGKLSNLTVTLEESTYRIEMLIP